MYMPGATAVGITYNEGVVFASEKRIAYGNFLVSKTTKKTFQITPKVGAACAGLVADMQILSLQVAALAKSQDKKYGDKARNSSKFYSKDDVKHDV